MTLTWRAHCAYIGAMPHRLAPAITHAAILAAALAVTLAQPVQAQPVQAQQDQAQQDQGPSLMERGAELFFDGLTQEMAPALNDLRGLAQQFGPSMQGFLDEMGPAFADIMGEVKDWSAYHPPETLPNGDIILRRKVDPRDEELKRDEALPPAGAIDI